MVHGPNRIVVRDEKENETVRRASHLKICNLKEKVTAMIHEHDEYKKFERSTKLLLDAKDVPHFQFPSETKGCGKILLETETSVIESTISPNNQDTASCGGLMVNRGEILPKAENSIKDANTNQSE